MQIDISDIDFSPIFNQSADVRTWIRFAEIEIKTQIEKYQYKLDGADKLRIMQDHAMDLKNFKYNFAFGAYHNEQMVGFASGYFIDDKDGKYMYLHNLYVLPQYNGLGIGKALLRHSENAAQLVAKDMRLVSLDGATGFYSNRGYSNVGGRYFYKTLNAGLLGTFPVFTWRKLMGLKYVVDFDRSLFIKNPFSPKFVYVASNKEIVGTAIKTPDNENHIFVTTSRGQNIANFYKQDLLNALSRAR